MKITANTKMFDVLKNSKGAAAVLKKYGLPCAGCKGAGEDSVSHAANNYSVNIDSLLADLNKA